MVDAATAAMPADRDNDPALVVFRETLSASGAQVHEIDESDAAEAAD